MIRFTVSYIRPVAILLIFVFLFQCCKAYSLKSTSIEEAVGPQKRYVRIVTTKGDEILFDSIYYRNDKLYGLIHKTKKTKSEEKELHEDSIQQVQIHLLNKPESNRRTLMLIVIPIVVIGGTILVGWLIFKDYSPTL